MVRLRFAAQNATQGADKGGTDFPWLDLWKRQTHAMIPAHSNAQITKAFVSVDMPVGGALTLELFCYLFS